MMDILISAILTVMTAATPFLFAALGELVTEKSGVLNLGVEGMMIMGAILGFVVVHYSGSATLAILASMGAGAFMAAIFGILVLIFHASQVPTGLALTIFGIGLSALIGQNMIGVAFSGLPKLYVPGISSSEGEQAVLGDILFSQDILVYLSFFMVIAVYWFINKSRAGLGAYLSLAYTPLWTEGMTAGRGWIALALVVFASWKVGRVLLGAYLFGGISILQLHAQALGIAIPAQLMSMLPYLTTIFVLVLISRDKTKIKLNAPASLGKPFHESR